jgi:hypothetical protein
MSSSSTLLSDNEILGKNNDGRRTDGLNINSDDDGKVSAVRNDINNVDPVRDCDDDMVDGKDPKYNNGRRADGCVTASDDGACVSRDGEGWIAVERKRRRKGGQRLVCHGKQPSSAHF